MVETIHISPDTVVRHIKLSRQLPLVTEAIATRQILTKTASELSLQIEPVELQEAADKFRLDNNLLSAELTWVWLQSHRLSLDDFEDLIYDTVLASKLAHHLFTDKVNSFFVEHQLEYAQAVIYEVVLGDRDLALELFYALQENEMNFWQLAHQYSDDPEQRRCLGYRGRLRRADLKPEISAAVFAAHPPQILKPVTVAKNTHLVLVEELLHPQLNDELYAQILSDLFSDWLSQQIAQAEINIDFNLSSGG